MYTYSFEKLEVWQLAHKFLIDIYILTRTFPDDEKFGMTNQLRRAALSISSNIAEGSSRKSLKDQYRFTEIAYGSLMESLNITIAAKDLYFNKQEEYSSMRVKIELLSNKLNAYYNSQKSRSKIKN
jgi:four helix bundle protein